MLDGRYTIKNENRERDDVAHSGSVGVIPESFGNVFAMDTSTLERYIPKSTLDYHLGKSSFARGVLMAGDAFWLDQLDITSYISCC